MPGLPSATQPGEAGGGQEGLCVPGGKVRVLYDDDFFLFSCSIKNEVVIMATFWEVTQGLCVQREIETL